MKPISAFQLIRKPAFAPLGVAALFACLVALFFWKVLLFPEKFHIPYDIHGFHYPLAYQIFVGLKNGYLPLWDPYVYSGMPLAGNIQAQLFYPPTLAFLKLSDWIYGSLPYKMIEYQLMLHYLIAGVSAYLLARSFDLSRAPAILSGIVYSFGGFFASQSQHLGLIDGAAWVPLIFCFLKRALDSRRLIYASGAAASLALAILAGFPALTIAAVTVMALGCLIIFAAEAKARSIREAAFVALALAVTVALALGLSAIQLMPAFELSGSSVARERPYYVATGGLPAQFLMSLLVPSLFGVGTREYWGETNETMVYLYVGIAPLTLALACVLCSRRKDVFLVLALTVFSLLWTLGEPLSAWVWMMTPPMLKAGIYAFCAKAFFDLGVALLAGLGLELLKNGLSDDELARIKSLLKSLTLLAIALIAVSLLINADAAAIEYGRPERGRLIAMAQGINVLILMLLLSCGAIYWCMSGRSGGSITAWLLILITTIDLFSFGSGKTFNTHEGDADDFITPETLDGRTHPLDLIKADPDYQRRLFLRIESVSAGSIWGTASRLWRLENANGDDPLLLESYAKFRQLFSDMDGRQFVLKDPSSRLLGLLNVKYVLMPKEFTSLQLPDNFRLISEDRWRIYLNEGFLPRAFLASQVLVEDDMSAVLRRLASPEFDPSRHIVLEKGLAYPEAGDEPPQQAVTGRAQIVSYTPNLISISVESSCDAFLLLSEIFYPGWNAYVDGRRQRILKANGIFRAVKVPGGKHSVVFRYEPRSLYVGATISALTLIFIFAWLLGGYFKAHR